MAKSKNKHKPKKNIQNTNRRMTENQGQQMSGRRQSAKPLWLRVVIITIMVVMLISLILPPLLRN